jgi:lipopolysaccharide transport system ATP-binding protein
MVRDRLGQDLFGENTLPFTEGQQLRALAGEQVYGDFVFRLPMLPNGQYTVTVSIADGTLHDHVQHHYLHDALVLTVASARVRWGLVGVQFDSVRLSVGSG